MQKNACPYRDVVTLAEQPMAHLHQALERLAATGVAAGGRRREQLNFSHCVFFSSNYVFLQ
jgi:hypothetical protein